MKKFFVTAAAVVMMSAACYAQDVNVSINGNMVNFPNQQPVVVDGRTLIPLRGVFDNMGYDIAWNGETKTVTLAKSGTTITVNIGESCYYLNGTQHSIDVPAQIINGSTMLPLRAIGDASGCQVLWDADTKTATIVDTDAYTGEAITGDFNVSNESEAQFIKDFSAVNEEYNKQAVEFFDFFNEINSKGITSADDMLKLGEMAKKMNTAAGTAKDKLNKLSTPSKYSELKTVSVEYMQAMQDLATLIDDIMNGRIDADAALEKLNKLGTDALAKEAKYQEVFKASAIK